MITLSNEQLKVAIAPKGAELQSIYHKKHNLEYLWNGDPAYWGKHSPILFPIVGQLKNDTYFFKDKEYHLPRHGFARDREFSVTQSAENKATFLLKSDDETRKNYPFDFILQIHYELQGAEVVITYEVENAGGETMYFSIGGHPAFNTPVEKDAFYTDYYLEFDKQEIATLCSLENGLIGSHTIPFTQNPIPLTHELFYKDALVFKHLNITKISLKSNAFTHGVTLQFQGFPYLGIWSAKDAPFVCIEPWQGIADSVTHNQQLTEKDGMIALDGGSSWINSWNILIH